jgi:WD40 repeat protein
MRCILVICVVWLFALGLVAAAETWGAIYDSLSLERATAIARASDGGYLIGGQTNAIDAASTDAMLLKLTATGSVTWAQACGWQGALSKEEEGFLAVEPTPDGGCLAAGWTSSTLRGATAAWIVRLDKDGQVLWQQAYGDGVRRAAIATSVVLAEDGGLIVGGLTYAGPDGDRDILIFRTDAQGDVAWDLVLGGVGYDAARTVKDTSDHGFVVLGRTEAYGAGAGDAWVLKLSQAGEVQWQCAYGGSLSDDANAILETRDGGFLIAGWSESFGAGGSDAWVVSLDSAGNVLWQKTYGGEGNDRIWGMLEMPDGTLVLVGETGLLGKYERDVWILKIDSAGHIINQTAYDAGGLDRARAVAEADGGFMVLAETNAYDLTRGDLWLLCLDAVGHLDGSAWLPQQTRASEGHGVATRTETTCSGRSPLLVNTSVFAGCGDIPVRTGLGRVDEWAGEPVFSVPFPSYDLQLSPSGSEVAIATGANVEIRACEDWGLIRTLSGHKGNVGAVAFSADGTLLSTASDSIQLWNAASGDLLRTLSGHRGWIKSLAFSPDGGYLASGSADLTVRVWRIADGALEETLLGHRGYVEAVAWGSEWDLLVSGGLDGAVLVWNPRSGTLLRTLLGHQGWVRCVAAQPRGWLLASGSADRTVKLWDLRSGECVATLTGLLDEAWSVTFSRDGRYLAAGGERGPVLLWDVETGNRIASLGHSGRAITSVQFLGSATHLLAATEGGNVFVWELGGLLL